MRRVVDDDAVVSTPAEDLVEKSLVQARGRSQGGGGGRRVTPTVDHDEGEDDLVGKKLLPNGDLYSGGFAGNAPHGRGKYLWADGCMYEGEWRRGKASGKGRFSWPSGATYEGEFRSGRMEGFGTFIGADGHTYHGQWVADRKQGFGSKSYVNGDYYEGLWRRNVQEGHGRYVWRNGNQYVGEWRGGIINGRGVLVWTNGNRYDGQWENGVPKGSSVFTWPDGSCYIGSWSRSDPKALDGTYYPATATPRNEIAAGRRSTSPFFQLDDGSPLVPSYRKRLSVDVVHRSPGRVSSVAEKSFPRICIWESDGEAGDITCDIIDNLEASMLYKERSLHEHVSGTLIGTIQRRQPFLTSEVKKPGQTISKGHKNYDLMLNLQLGIRYSIGKPGSAHLRELKQEDFDPMEKFWTRFPPEGSKNTPPHQSPEFRWKDYCPMVFRHLRKLFSVDPADYMLAICGNDALRELSSPGKSGSFFFMTQDDRFMIKTVKKSEVKVLIRMLASYYLHVCEYEKTLVTKFYGVHCVKPNGGQKVRFVVMGNLFCSEYQIHRRFDLKGSSYGRTTEKTEEEIDETTTLKDLDLNLVFLLQNSWYKELREQIKQDCEFLESEGIMDYSLLVGVHFLSPPLLASPQSSKNESFQHRDTWSDQCNSTFKCQDTDQIPGTRKPLVRLGANMPARAEHATRNGLVSFIPASSGMSTPTASGELYDVLLYFGIIDILQDYDITKKLEHAYKSLQVDPNSISAVDPKLYSRRFQDFISKIFVQDD